MLAMTDQDPVVEAIKELHGELRALHEAHVNRRWFEREPFKSMLTHAVTVIVAVCAGYSLHILTGAPVSIETASASKEKNVVEVPMPSVGSPSVTGMAAISEVVEPVPSVTVQAAKPVVAASKKLQRPSKVEAPMPAAAPAQAIDNVDSK